MSFDTSALLSQLTGIRDERRLAANTATRVGEALIALMNYAGNGPYLRKDGEDSTQFLLRLLGGAVIGEGAVKLMPDGSITCGNIRVNGSALFQELVFNHQNILEGDTYFTDRATVEHCETVDGQRYTLTIRKEYDDEMITFHVNDVCRQVINRLDTGRTYYTSWFRVESIDNANSQMTVVLYPHNEVPGGVNYAPHDGGKMIRWGNAADASRQSCFYVSSTDGRFLFLQGVTKPIIDDTNYSAFLGLPPDMEQLRDLPINKRQPYVYARGLIVQDFITVDYKGNPEYKQRDRGYWSSGETYIRGYDDVAKGYYQDRVWYGGCLWQCVVPQATVGLPPRWNNTEWVCLVGGENMSMDIVSTMGDFFRAGSRWETELQASLYNAEMLLSEVEIGRECIYWTRESGETTADEAWNARHGRGKDGFRLRVSSETDLPSSWGPGSQVAFICTVEIPEGETYSVGYSIE